MPEVITRAQRKRHNSAAFLLNATPLTHVRPYVTSCGWYCAEFSFPNGLLLHAPVTETWKELKDWLKDRDFLCQFEKFDVLWNSHDKKRRRAKVMSEFEISQY